MDRGEFIKRIPKTDLHCHLDGSARPDTIFELAQKSKINLAVRDPESLKREIQIFHECNSLKDYLQKFNIPIQVMQSEEALYRITFELLEDAGKDGIRYLEIRFSPFQHLRNGLKAEGVIEAVLRAMQDGLAKLQIFSGLILCCLRNNAPAEDKKVIDLARRYRDHGVVAVDLAGNETDFPPELHTAAFDLAYHCGLNITIHAGETGIAGNILKSIRLLHADRIGHGVFAYQDRETLDYLIRSQIPLEICPTSNWHTKAVTSYETHPIKRYLEMGINVTLNTDNRTVSNVTLMDEYLNLITKLQMDTDAILRIIYHGIVSSFAPEKVKRIVLREFREVINFNSFS